MRPLICLVLASIVPALALAPTANAAYYIGQGVAESYARDWMHTEWPGEPTGAACSPKRGRNESVRHRGRRLYHVWVCGFAVGVPGASCKGLVSIKGSDAEPGYYYYRHTSRGEIC